MRLSQFQKIWLKKQKNTEKNFLNLLLNLTKHLLEKFFDDPNSISEAEILKALREATISMAIVPMVCGSSFKNKGVQTMLDYVMELIAITDG